MGLDIRLPIGLLFSIFGVLLVAYGAFGNKDIYARSLDVNINLWWGIIMLVFGLLMFLLGKRGTKISK
jgi:multisubunit Na+/H+ antiporter MnhG subunit